MFRVLGCITEQHDLRLVVLAALLCFFACTTAMSMIARGRAASGRLRMMWLAAAGIVAGCGIWGLHFIAMLAYRAGLPVAYDVWLTSLSVVIAMSLCAAGFIVAFTRAGPAVGALHRNGGGSHTGRCALGRSVCCGLAYNWRGADRGRSSHRTHAPRSA
jgi:NO-binding membrane sensor protein with MHYT domain